jgi:hypothetical protein
MWKVAEATDDFQMLLRIVDWGRMRAIRKRPCT